MQSFAIDFADTPFLKTSSTGASANRLNWRAEILLTRNRAAIAGKRVLDLASHDGRFSYACLRLGAEHVTGVEGRAHLAEHAVRNLQNSGYGRAKIRFIEGDVLAELQQMEPRSFDLILCFGFFYHTTSQVELLAEIKRLRPQTLILDTTVDVSLSKPNASYLRFYQEKPDREANTIHASGLVAKPSQSLIELLLSVHGYRFRELLWSPDEIEDWSHIENYRDKERVSYLAEL